MCFILGRPVVEWTTVASSRSGLTLGLLVCVTAVAFESMAVVTAMPAAAADLGDERLYAWAFSAVMIPQLFAVAAADEAMPPLAHGPKLTPVAGRPCARRCAIRPSSRALAVA